MCNLVSLHDHLLDNTQCRHTKPSTFQRLSRPAITPVLYPWPVLPEQTNNSRSVVINTVIVAAADAVVLGRPRRHVAAGDVVVT